jgi:hypothetical protein
MVLRVAFWRKSKYLAVRYTERLAEAGVVASAESKGDSYDTKADPFDSARRARRRRVSPLLDDPVVYSSGYLMHRRPTSLADARALARERFLVGQGQADGRGGGRTAYAVRLVRDSGLGAAGTLVGTSSLAEADLHHEKTTWARLSTAAAGGTRLSTPRPSCCS